AMADPRLMNQIGQVVRTGNKFVSVMHETPVSPMTRPSTREATGIRREPSPSRPRFRRLRSETSAQPRLEARRDRAPPGPAESDRADRRYGLRESAPPRRPTERAADARALRRRRDAAGNR